MYDRLLARCIDENVHVVGFPGAVTDEAQDAKRKTKRHSALEHEWRNAKQLLALPCEKNPQFGIGPVARPPGIQPVMGKKWVRIGDATEEFVPLRTQGFKVRVCAHGRDRDVAVRRRTGLSSGKALIFNVAHMP